MKIENKTVEHKYYKNRTFNWKPIKEAAENKEKESIELVRETDKTITVSFFAPYKITAYNAGLIGKRKLLDACEEAASIDWNW